MNRPLVLVVLVSGLFFQLAGVQAQENLARLAEVSGPGENLVAAVDGIKQKQGTGEWIGDSPNHWWGEIVYPALDMQWKHYDFSLPGYNTDEYHQYELDYTQR